MHKRQQQVLPQVVVQVTTDQIETTLDLVVMVEPVEHQEKQDQLTLDLVI